MNVLVTGGAGFIASHIVDRLIGLGHTVFVIDNLSTGRKAYVNPHATMLEADIVKDDLSRVFAAARAEAVIHHAAQIDVQTSLKSPALDAEINIVGTIRLLEQCRDQGVRKFVYASSAAVYGAPEYAGIDERHPIHPLSFYGISKHTPELYLEAFARLYGIDYTILRYANVYGYRQDSKGEAGVISIFVDKLLQGETPLIYGDGEQTRDFVYVKDIVEANLLALHHSGGATFNISSNTQTTINTLLRLLCDLTERPFAPKYAPERPGDVIHSRLDNSKAVAELGWKPVYSLREGLKETCDQITRGTP
ncbi:NAD-dependent epimerase/dehydratase family protein [Paenibacillus thalictri]|uniref:NAD-dependent epimerase/dehydratase family protein n=1 Tax=Paenibacillus thalictri TaxID=2527873 RepID=A0A4Q9DWU5_9BACL|nr:NAD-dependent epimerase/dehydratase family protein [Paenibacillus thalictri]TBL81574.1 NAD-dependent epimerase/dehydratase family protein [Paenibacillus thalictri]